MTVKELTERLKEFDENKTVYVWSDKEFYPYDPLAAHDISETYVLLIPNYSNLS